MLWQRYDGGSNVKRVTHLVIFLFNVIPYTPGRKKRRKKKLPCDSLNHPWKPIFYPLTPIFYSHPLCYKYYLNEWSKNYIFFSVDNCRILLGQLFLFFLFLKFLHVLCCLVLKEVKRITRERIKAKEQQCSLPVLIEISSGTRLSPPPQP